MNPLTDGAVSSHRGARAAWILAIFALPGLFAACSESKKTVLAESAPPVDEDGPPPDDGRDTDGDGLTDHQEFVGWDITVDFEGYGSASAVSRRVTSDPLSRDTDGDGLSDRVEHRLRTDPRSADTDGDGLDDRDEVRVWRTKPASVDTDGDARGPRGDLPPNPLLFDKNEWRVVGTSPTLADTDGDGRTDCEEFDDPVRNPLVAEMPSAEIAIVGDIDLRLNVQYAEELSRTREYGSRIEKNSSLVREKSKSKTSGWSLESSVSPSFEAGSESEGEGDKKSKKKQNKKSVGLGVTGGYSSETTETTTVTSSRSVTREFMRFQSDSEVRTETATSGSIAVGVSVSNPTPIAYQLENFGLTVLLRSPEPGDEGPQQFKTLAVLRPDVPSVVLAPGEATDPILVGSDDVNVDRVKEFMANPDALVFRPTEFSLRDGEGRDFDFLVETTLPRTAIVEIDYGDGTVEFYRVATNVRRGPRGRYLGITIREALEKILRIDFATTAVEFPDPEIEGATRTERVLTRLGGRAGAAYGGVGGPGVGDLGDFQIPSAAWIVRHEVADPAFAGDDVFDFADLTLRAGDEIRLIYLVDADDDGLASRDEELFGTSDEGRDLDGDGVPDGFDTDQDGLDDRTEIEGWIVNAPELDLASPRYVRSDPRLADTDGDGLTDFEEMALLGPDGLEVLDENGNIVRLDPTNADTDGDGILDDDELFVRDEAAGVYRACHIHAARVLRVVPDGVPCADPSDPQAGRTWDKALNLRCALDLAGSGARSADCTDDVAEIWCRSGQYGDLVDSAISGAVYGGFSGTEEKRGARNSDPLTNDSVLVPLNPVVLLDSGGTLDGFRIERTGRSSPAVWLLTDSLPPRQVVLRNLLVLGSPENSGVTSAAVEVLFGARPDVLFEDCLFAGNRNGTAIDPDMVSRDHLVNDRFGGAVRITESGRYVFERCQFVANEAATFGGAVYVGQGTTSSPPPLDVTVDFRECMFSGNVSWFEGGAIWAGNMRSDGGSVRINVASCEFDGNVANLHGGGLALFNAQANVINSTFQGNRADDTVPKKDLSPWTLTDPLAELPFLRGNFRFGGAVMNRSGRLFMTNTTLTKNIVFHGHNGDSRYPSLGAGAVAHVVGVRGSVVPGIGPGYTRMANCVLWGNVIDNLRLGAISDRQKSQAHELSRETTAEWDLKSPDHFAITDSVIQALTRVDRPGPWPSMNISADPSFLDFELYVDAELGSPGPENERASSEPYLSDLRFNEDSPCIDIGDLTVDIDIHRPGVQLLTSKDLDWYPGPVDKDGNPSIQPRLSGGRPKVDLGAFEYQPPE